MANLVDIPVLLTQILGFLIVLWVLKRYAWKPVLGLLEERRARIAGEVASATRMREEAERLKAEYEDQLKTIETQSRQRIQEAVKEGQKVAEEIRAKAHGEAQRITEKAKADLELEYKKARTRLREEMVTLALGAAERLLQERMDDQEHRKLVDKFLTELQERQEETA
jgi:F-type H+-transporting ATPase subunit b